MRSLNLRKVAAKSRRRNASSKFANHKEIDEKFIKAFIVLTCATSLQADGKYAPEQRQNDELIATYEIFFKYDLRNGEKDASGKIRNRLYVT